MLKEVERKHNLSKSDEKQELFKQISESILEQVAYIKELPLWYLRGAYWYFISRSLNVNKKVFA